jgi:hypothetical protein
MGTEPPFKSRFLLGTHQPTWLRHVDIPLFVSHTRLHRQRRLPRAHCQWALDSGAFSEIAIHGEYRRPAGPVFLAVDPAGRPPSISPPPRAVPGPIGVVAADRGVIRAARRRLG